MQIPQSYFLVFLREKFGQNNNFCKSFAIHQNVFPPKYCKTCILFSILNNLDISTYDMRFCHICPQKIALYGTTWYSNVYVYIKSCMYTYEHYIHRTRTLYASCIIT